jgi:hypothetical protein
MEAQCPNCARYNTSARDKRVRRAEPASWQLRAACLLLFVVEAAIVFWFAAGRGAEGLGRPWAVAFAIPFALLAIFALTPWFAREVYGTGIKRFYICSQCGYEWDVMADADDAEIDTPWSGVTLSAGGSERELG